MATATFPLVPVDEYLKTSYEPDVEYVDGTLVQKGIPTIAHNFLGRLLFWFARFERQFGFTAMYDARTQIVARTRYRLPDMMLCPMPLPQGRIVDVAPWVVEKYLAHRFDNGSMTMTSFKSLTLPTGEVPFDSDELFNRLRTELANRREA